MIFRTRFAFALALVVGAAACGNYSNDDLEYMNAVPAGSQLGATLPAYSSSLPTASEAELAQTTHSVTAVFNQMLDNALGGVDAIRSHEPTSRTPGSRIWGPFPSDKQLGWDWRLTVSHDDPQTTRFTYLLEVENTGDPSQGWVPFLSGYFDATAGVRKGTGSMTMDTTALSSAGFPFDQGTVPFMMLTVTYETVTFPINVAMTIMREPDATNQASSVVYTNAVQADGSGQMTFTLTGNFITGPAIETVAISSAWLPSGAGKATEMVEQGDAAGSTQIECWDATFASTYDSKPWTTPPELSGDASACPALPIFQ